MKSLGILGPCAVEFKISGTICCATKGDNRQDEKEINDVEEGSEERLDNVQETKEQESEP